METTSNSLLWKVTFVETEEQEGFPQTLLKMKMHLDNSLQDINWFVYNIHVPPTQILDTCVFHTYWKCPVVGPFR